MLLQSGGICLKTLEDGGSRSLEVLVPIYQSMWHHIPEDTNLYIFLKFCHSFSLIHKELL
jgi:hypothetical protein